MATHSSILSRKSHGQRSLVGYSPWGNKESDVTEQLSMCAPVCLFAEMYDFSFFLISSLNSCKDRPFLL